MAKFYIQTDKGLIKVGNDITLENIKAALGYTPSNFSGDFYDLTNNYQYIKKIMSVLYSQLIDYNLMSNRGMWYYPFSYPEIYDDTTYEGVVNTLNRFKTINKNYHILRF